MRHPIAARRLARPRAAFYAFDLFVPTTAVLPEVGIGQWRFATS
jgi:hypothetical protein